MNSSIEEGFKKLFPIHQETLFITHLRIFPFFKREKNDVKHYLKLIISNILQIILKSWRNLTYVKNESHCSVFLFSTHTRDSS